MNSKITNENTLRIEDLFKRAINNNKKSASNFSNIVLNQNELDILSKEILEENKPQLVKEDNNQININLSKAEINTLLNEINNNTNIKKEEKSFLNKKRKKNFISVKIQQEKQNFIHYKQKQQINEESDNSRNKISLLSYNILNQIFMKKMNRPDLNIDYRMNKIVQEILKLDPDVFFLQEADIYVYKKYLLKKEMEQYNILYGINCGSSFINIIAYKKDKFELKSFKNFSLLFLGKSAGNRGIMTVDLQLINPEVNNNINNDNNINNLNNNTINNDNNNIYYKNIMINKEPQNTLIDINKKNMEEKEASFKEENNNNINNNNNNLESKGEQNKGNINNNINKNIIISQGDFISNNDNNCKELNNQGQTINNNFENQKKIEEEINISKLAANNKILESNIEFNQNMEENENNKNNNLLNKKGNNDLGSIKESSIKEIDVNNNKNDINNSFSKTDPNAFKKNEHLFPLFLYKLQFFQKDFATDTG